MLNDRLYQHRLTSGCIQQIVVSNVSAYLKYFSVFIGSNVINVLLLYIIIYIRCCKTQDMMATASRLSIELETSTKILDRFSLEQNVSVPPNVLQQCIRKEDEVVKRLSNCNLTYLQPRAFAECPMMEVRICTNVNNLWISILYFLLVWAKQGSFSSRLKDYCLKMMACAKQVVHQGHISLTWINLITVMDE